MCNPNSGGGQANPGIAQLNNEQLLAALSNINPALLEAVKNVKGGGGGPSSSEGAPSSDMFSRR